jgi:ribose-phosphate pyrophosphokinase
MCKYVAYLIDTLNNDATISTLLNPVKRIQSLMDKHRKELESQMKIEFEE